MVESIKELALKKTVNKIHVSDITRNCQMSSSSFYHYFGDKFELISYILNKEIDRRIGDAEDMSLNLLYDTILDILDEDRQFYANVLINTLNDYPNHAFFHAALDGKISDLIESECMNQRLSKDLELTLQVYLAGVTAAMCRYITGSTLRRNELVRAFIVAIPDRLKPVMIVSGNT